MFFWLQVNQFYTLYQLVLTRCNKATKTEEGSNRPMQYPAYLFKEEVLCMHPMQNSSVMHAHAISRHDKKFLAVSEDDTKFTDGKNI